MKPFLDRRRAGVLLHISSLPDSPGNGDFSQAKRFIDFIHDCGLGVWQVLPMGPTHFDHSPYLSLSAHAGDPALIGLPWLQHQPWFTGELLANAGSPGYREECLRLAFECFHGRADEAARRSLRTFVENHAHWLDDYALFSALHDAQENKSWVEWPPQLRDREPRALDRIRQQLQNEIELKRFQQFVFFSQWAEIKAYAKSKDVLLFGDIPLYVAHDSADVWVHRRYFDLDEEGYPVTVAGVPPDYFSATGQRWGNPQYCWQRMQADGFSWWLGRVATQAEYFDLLRIDHFRGLQAYWEVPAQEPDACGGRWVKAPGEALLKALQHCADTPQLVAEDLGTLTPEVEQLREKFELPGMNILQFAFDGGDNNPYLREHHRERSVVYTGTHDNDTSLAWYQALDQTQRQRVNTILGCSDAEIPWALIRYGLSSPARLMIAPLQDLLSLPEGNRMNLPGTTSGNWQWRFCWQQIPASLAPGLKQLVKEYGRD